MFYWFGGAGFLWVVAWFSVIAETPQSHKTIHPNERNYLSMIAPPAPQSEAISTSTSSPTLRRNPITRAQLLMMARHRGVWALMCVSTFLPFTFYAILAELPSFLSSVHGVSIQQAGLLSIIPYVLIAISTIVGGFIADYLIQNSNKKRLTIRKLMVVLSLIPLTVAVCFVGYVTTVFMTMLLVSVTMLFYGLNYAGTSALIFDISETDSALFYGMFNTVNQVRKFACDCFGCVRIDSSPLSCHHCCQLFVCLFVCSFVHSFVLYSR
jgi:ACS family sodium-dependent inorganic phosphate cotransporter